MTGSAIKRAQDADPNGQRCLIENCSTNMAVQLGHVYNREETASDYEIQSLEWSWGLIKGSLNLDTKRNVFFVGASLYELYKRHQWSLVPEEKVVSQFFYECRSRPRRRSDFPKLQSQTFKYTFLPIKRMEDVCITRQSDGNTVTIYEHPFSGFPTITSHIHPTFVLLHLTNALWSITRERYDAIVRQYPWLRGMRDLHTMWFARLPGDANRNPTYVPPPQSQSLLTSQPAPDDNIFRTPPRRIPVLTSQRSNEQILQRLDAEPIDSPPSSTRAAPRSLQVTYISGQKREASEPIRDARPNKGERLLTSTDLKQHDEHHDPEVLE
ncbi:hypothetical protein CVT24_005229 [Panaeolus cyanescens]|uniref:HNH nuclease domain-containing protein n=1 Tax=Panaeolus cyanescens TaxID=181874 RepID=A0A409Y9S8_9AGAR|nr:hypothetical protein CVT24_005229 [Panaeolus cyanescens]